MQMNHSQAFSFDGGALDYFAARMISIVLTVMTLGLALPWSVCIMERWRAKHTILNGQRLAFTGTGLQLFGQYLKWWFLCGVTFGIYLFWLAPKITQWTTQNTELGAKA
jgi:uncharacterized membrane protein YjgN (DUF898 family)